MKSLLLSINFFVICLVLFSQFPISVKAQASKSVVINELMPNPVGTDTGNEWVELYNPTAERIPLDGWSLKDKTSNFSLSGKSVEAGSYLVIFPSISLNNTDEELTLSDSQGYSDFISYASSAEGKSLERIHPDCAEFIEHPTADTKGVVNFNYNANGCTTSGTETIGIFTKEKDGTEWKSEHTYLVGSTIQVRFDREGTEPINKIEWSFENFTYNTETVELNLSKIGSGILKLTIMTDTQAFVSETNIITEPNIRLNEILADPDGSDSGHEWIELYNPATDEVDLNNWSINMGSKSQKIGRLKISPKGYAVIVTNISIPNTGSEVSLISPNGLIVDSFQYTDTEIGKSWGRILDGVGDWFISDETKGVTNTIFQNKISSEQIENVAGVNIENFEPNLSVPKYNGLSPTSVEENIDVQIVTDKIKSIDVNEPAFAGFLIGEVGIFGAAFLKKEELSKIFSFILHFFKG